MCQKTILINNNINAIITVLLEMWETHWNYIYIYINIYIYIYISISILTLMSMVEQ